MLNIFITGTDINVGKTFITAGLAATMQSLGYSTCVYKPIQTGAADKNGIIQSYMQSPDLMFVRNIDPYIKTFSSYLFKAQASPVIASEMEFKTIDKNFIKKDFDMLAKSNDCTIVESTGGIMTPLAPNLLTSDLIKTLDLPVILVVKPDSSTVNNSLLAINHAQSKGINIRGVIINNCPDNTKNIDIKTVPRLIEEYSDIKILGIVKSFRSAKNISPSDLITSILNGIDIESVFDVKIAKLDLE